MRSNRLMFSVLYLLGLVLCISLFMIFVPPESRTPVKWMNFGIGLFIYSGLWGKVSLLYPALGHFSDNTPTLSVYWISFGWYVASSLVAMLLFWLLGVGIEKQAILQGVLLFGFIVCLAMGVGASNFMVGETKRSQAQIGGVRMLQLKANQIKIFIDCLPSNFSSVRNEYDKIVDAVTYLCGSNNSMAGELESQILALLDKLKLQVDIKAAPDDCLATIGSLLSVIALRKTISNV